MSKTAILPADVKQECIWIVRGYKRRVDAYLAARRDIIDGTSCRYEIVKDKRTGKYIRVYPPSGHVASRSSEEKTMQLAAIEEWPETKRMRAVEQAKLQVGTDVVNSESRMKLLDAILLNCAGGRKYPFRVLNITEFSERDFYRRRDTFLADVAKYLGLI